MSTRKIFRISALLIALVMLFTATMQTTMAFVVTKTDSIINIFLPFKGLVSDLIINKTVEHPFGDDYVYPDNIKFDFKVELGDFYANAKLATTAGEVVADENGSFTVSVKPGTPVGIEDLDEGTVVKVTELIDNMGKGFAVKDDADSAEVIIPADGSVVVDITNVYSPENVFASCVNLVGTKVLEGRDWQEGDTFSFALERKGDDGQWITVDTQSIAYDAENAQFNSFDFNDFIHSLEFSEIGTYSFRVSEIEGDSDEIIYDKSVFYFNLAVGDPDMDGDLDITNVTVGEGVTLNKADGVYDLSVQFDNTFVEDDKPIPDTPEKPIPDDIKVNVAVNKTVVNKGEKEIGPENFRFVLENIDTAAQIVMVSDEAGLANVDINFTADDIGKTYSYKLYEMNEGAEYVTYSEKVYEIAVTISLDEEANVLVANATVDGADAESIVGAFENIYDYTPPMAPPTSDNMLVPVALFVASAAILVVLFVTRKKKESIFE